MAFGCALTGAASADPGCGGLLQPPCQPPPPPPPQDPPPQQQQPPPPGKATITLKANRPYSVYRSKSTVTFTGRVRGAPAGSRPRLVLKAWSAAYGQPLPDVPGRTDSAGRFRIVALQQVSATYRVTIAKGESVEGTSRRVRTIAFPSFSLGYGQQDRIYLVVHAPAHLSFKRSTVRPRADRTRFAFFYGIPRHSKRAYRFGRARFESTQCDDYVCVRRAGWLIRDSRRLRQAKRILGCSRGSGFRGMGGLYGACGRRVIKLR
jgi:hypothetical protein